MLHERRPLKATVFIIPVTFQRYVGQVWEAARVSLSQLEPSLQPNLQRDTTKQPKDPNTSDVGVTGPLTASAFSSEREVIREQMLDVCLPETLLPSRLHLISVSGGN